MTPIIAGPSVTLTAAQAWAQSRNAAAVFVDDMTPALYRQAVKVGVAPGVAIAQSAKETGYGRFGRAVTPEHRNTCGLKVRDPDGRADDDPDGRADDDPDAHARFATWDDGALAHVSHLALYAGHLTAAEARANGDPRAFPHLYGTAETVEALGGKWAPASDYGTSIVRDYMNSMEAGMAITPDRARADWDAPAPPRAHVKVTHTHLEFHHDVYRQSLGWAAPQHLQRIDAQHRGQGWNGIFYNLFLDRDGALWEARGIGNQSTGKALTIVLPGDYENHDQPTEAQLATIRRLRAQMPKGLTWHRERAMGTRNASACPGRNLIPHLEAIRSGAVAPRDPIEEALMAGKLIRRSDGHVFEAVDTRKLVHVLNGFLAEARTGDADWAEHTITVPASDPMWKDKRLTIVGP